MNPHSPLKQTLHVIKIGGNVIDDADLLQGFLADIVKFDAPIILVHGGGKTATSVAESMGIPQTLIEGRRITNADTLQVAVMVYAGWINKSIVAKMQALKCKAIGLCGADGNLVQSTRREVTNIDYGFVGDVDVSGVNVAGFVSLIENGQVPVISAITHDGNGTLLNTNADVMAARIAVALASPFYVTLTYCFEQVGVLQDPSNQQSLLSQLNREEFVRLKETGAVSAGMIPKLDNAFNALENGVAEVSICHAKNISTLSATVIGTTLL